MKLLADAILRSRRFLRQGHVTDASIWFRDVKPSHPTVLHRLTMGTSRAAALGESCPNILSRVQHRAITKPHRPLQGREVSGLSRIDINDLLNEAELSTCDDTYHKQSVGTELQDHSPSEPFATSDFNGLDAAQDSAAYDPNHPLCQPNAPHSYPSPPPALSAPINPPHNGLPQENGVQDSARQLLDHYTRGSGDILRDWNRKIQLASNWTPRPRRATS